MALTNITSAPSQQLATPSYDALFQGTAAGEASKMAGAKFKADSIKEGLQNFEENQQLLSKHMGIFQGALASNPEFKSIIEGLDPKSDMGKAVTEATRGNASLTSMLALSNFATEYGAGEAAQANIARAEEVTKQLQMENNATAEVDNANEFLDNLVGPDGLINAADIQDAINKAKENGVVFAPGYRTALTDALETRQTMGQIKSPIIAPQITPVYKVPGDKTSGLFGYVISDQKGRPVTAFETQDNVIDYTDSGRLKRNLQVYEAMGKEKNEDGTLRYDPNQITALVRSAINNTIGSTSKNNAVGQAFNIVRNELNIAPYVNGVRNPEFWDNLTSILKMQQLTKRPKEETKQNIEDFTTTLMVEYGYGAGQLDQIQTDIEAAVVKATSSSNGWE